MVSEEIRENLEFVSEVMEAYPYSIVVVENKQVLAHKTGEGVRPFIELIDELGNSLEGKIIGDRILGKASALLCAYSQVAGVYAPQATKTAIAVLIQAGIPGETDKLIDHVSNRFGTGVCPFEEMLTEVDEAEQAFVELRKAIQRFS